MKKKKVFSAVRRDSKRVKGISREVRVLDLHSAYGISKDAISTLMVMANPHGALAVDPQNHYLAQKEQKQ